LLKTIKFSRWCFAASAYWLMSGLATAQEITSISLPSTSVDQNSEIVFTVQLQKIGATTWCGLQMNFGNGDTRMVRVGDKGEEDLSTRIAYQYPNAGTYTASVEGKLLIRGIKTATPCGGERQQITVTVIDAETKRLREELLRAEADKRDREEKERKAKDIERQKAAELAQKEEELKKREQELRKQTELKKAEAKKVEAAKPVEKEKPAAPKPAEVKKEEPQKPKAKAESIL
jgi:hypothetical protein